MSDFESKIPPGPSNMPLWPGHELREVSLVYPDQAPHPSWRLTKVDDDDQRWPIPLHPGWYSWDGKGHWDVVTPEDITRRAATMTHPRLERPTLADTRRGADWCPCCDQEAGTARYGARCSVCGTELVVKPAEELAEPTRAYRIGFVLGYLFVALVLTAGVAGAAIALFSLVR